MVDSGGVVQSRSSIEYFQGLGSQQSCRPETQRTCQSPFGLSGFSFLFRIFEQRLSRLFGPNRDIKDGCFTLTLDYPPLLSRCMMIVIAEQPYP